MIMGSTRRIPPALAPDLGRLAVAVAVAGSGSAARGSAAGDAARQDSMRSMAGRARAPDSSAAAPPTTRDQRAPVSWATQPTIGPPIGVEPSQASAHRAMTRPRIVGLAASCRVVLASELNVMLP